MIFDYSKAVAIVYGKPTASGAQNQPLAAAEITKFLAANSQDQTWKEDTYEAMPEM